MDPLRKRRCCAASSALLISTLTSGWSAEARAAESFSCETTSSRPSSEIWVTRFRGRSGRVVRVLPGETLCVTGTIDEHGALVEPRLIDPTDATGTPTIAIVLSRGATTVLRIRHSFGRPLVYHLGLVLTKQRLVQFGYAKTRVSPDRWVEQSWDAGVYEVVLTDFELLRSEPVEAPARPAEPQLSPEQRRVAATLAVWTGEREARMSALNRALTRDGFSPIPATRLMAGADLDVELWRIRFGASFGFARAESRNAATGVELPVSLIQAGVTAGFDFFRYRSLSLFAATGILGTGLFLDPRARGLTLFESRLEQCDQSAGNGAGLVLLELGIEHLIPLGRAGESGIEIFGPYARYVMQFGLRAGWLQQAGGESGWSLSGRNDEPRSVPGPHADWSGPAFRAVLGFGEITGP